ncbi:MAG TPA: glycoside hydrolase family 16 protein [Terriglobales bacterium]|nr:glycoside hydrolase family 16 protein [Terriglobales bacterium]
MTPGRSSLVAIFAFILLFTTSLFAQNWSNPVWSDEFTGAPNSAPDPTKWTFDVGNLNVNHELEIYCSNPIGTSPAPCNSTTPSAYLNGNGQLVIEARNNNGTWTSARLKTQGIPSENFQYGRIEASIKLPSATGLWPAFWMLGTSIDTVSWPACGEIDIMENVLTAPLGANRIASTIHGPGYSGSNGISKQYTFPNNGTVDDGYHIYGAIWSPYLIQFYVDDPSNIFQTIPATAIPSGTQWVYNNNFFLILNLAVGGDWPGPPDASTPSPSQMLVDYVRVYKAAPVAGPTMSASAMTVTAGQTGSSMLNLTSTAGSGKVFLTCSNSPANSTCSVSPSYVDFTSSATATATVNLATQPHSSARQRFKAGLFASLAMGGISFGMLLIPGLRRRQMWLVLGLGLLLLPILAINGCGGGGSSPTPTPATGGTPNGSYNMTVTAYTVSGDQSSTNVAVTIN